MASARVDARTVETIAAACGGCKCAGFHRQHAATAASAVLMLLLLLLLCVCVAVGMQGAGGGDGDAARTMRLHEGTTVLQADRQEQQRSTM